MTRHACSGVVDRWRGRGRPDERRYDSDLAGGESFERGEVARKLLQAGVPQEGCADADTVSGYTVSGATRYGALEHRHGASGLIDFESTLAKLVRQWPVAGDHTTSSLLALPTHRNGTPHSVSSSETGRA